MFDETAGNVGVGRLADPGAAITVAIGAKPRHIAAQILIESMLTTLGAAIVGTVLGLTGALIYSRLNDWVSIVEPWHLAAIPIAAAVLGVIAGMLPARRASTIDPSVALRQ